MKNQDRKLSCTLWYFFLVLGCFLMTTDLVYGESLYSTMEKGNTLYKDKKYDEALKSFVDAQIESPENPNLKYNLANAHYKMKNYEEAVKNYQDVVATAWILTTWMPNTTWSSQERKLKRGLIKPNKEKNSRSKRKTKKKKGKRSKTHNLNCLKRNSRRNNRSNSSRPQKENSKKQAKER